MPLENSIGNIQHGNSKKILYYLATIPLNYEPLPSNYYPKTSHDLAKVRS